MKLFSKGRRGQVTRHPEPPARRRRPRPRRRRRSSRTRPVYELTGVRRSVFDLLKEKYPDLAPGSKNPDCPGQERAAGAAPP